MRATIAALSCAFAMTGMAAVAQPAPAAPAAGAATVTVQVVSMHSSKGSVQCLLYAGDVGFPGKPDKAVARLTVPIADEASTCVFPNLTAGDYAIELFHDENGNGKLDTGFLGIPSEGFGASNDAPEKFGPPKYADAKFTVTGDQTITIHMTYIGGK
jgi:uncharacterized protein (DUF2141 family)